MGQKTRLPFRLHTHRSGTIYIRFTHAGVFYDRSLGTKSSLEALGRARVKYHEITTGEAPGKSETPAVPILPLVDTWTTLISGESVDPETAKIYKGYGKLWHGFFKDVKQIGTRIEAYTLLRLSQVLRSTVIKELAALRGFVRWCVREKKVLPTMPHIPPPEKGLKGKRVNPDRKRTGTLIAPGDIRRILKALPERSRNRVGGEILYPRAFYTVCYETGLRPVTVEQLRKGRHFKPGAKELWVEGAIDKADFDRRVPLSKVARRALEAVAAGRADGALLFGDHEHKRALKAACAELGIEGVSKYDFKHSRATHWLEAGGDLPGTSFLLGHLRVTSTARYIKPNEAAAKKMLSRSESKRS
jgi:integrase